MAGGTGGAAGMGGAALPVCQADLRSTVPCYTKNAAGEIATQGYYKGSLCTRCGVVLYTCSLTGEPGDSPQVCVQSCDSCTDWH